MNNLIRPNIAALQPYSSARAEYDGSIGIFLDANENPFDTSHFGYPYNELHLHRYPDPYQKKLKQKLGSMHGIGTDNIFIGNGSDEVIDLAMRIFCNPGKDSVIICPPTYGMYEVSARINDIGIVYIPLNEDYQPDIENIMKTQSKMIFLCSPNNPTGNTVKNIEYIVKNFKGIVFVDEAYIDFSTQESFLHKVNIYPNLIVSQTLSKAWGKAAIRIGFAYAGREIIALYNKIKPPYNISQLNQYEALRTLEATDDFIYNKQVILTQRAWLTKQLSMLNFVETVYPSDANFILVKVKNANTVYEKLRDEGIIVRNRHSIINNCLRITVGKPTENIKLIESLSRFHNEETIIY
ncbi:MAG: histidinol-phosphate transaminase [Candidatus Kapaibacterium sp.]|jgi:histidinol-phosphate aminotransferase